MVVFVRVRRSSRAHASSIAASESATPGDDGKFPRLVKLAVRAKALRAKSGLRHWVVWEALPPAAQLAALREGLQVRQSESWLNSGAHADSDVEQVTNR